jgi:hypothetical protein
MMVGPPLAPTTMKGWPSLRRRVGDIDDRGALARGDGVGLGADEAEGVGGAGLLDEVVHLVVEEDAKLRDEDEGAKGGVHGGGAGDHVVVGVDDREVAGAVVVGEGRFRREGGGVVIAGEGGVGEDAGAAGAGGVGGEQALDGDGDEVGVGQELGAVGEGELQGLARCGGWRRCCCGPSP